MIYPLPILNPLQKALLSNMIFVPSFEKRSFATRPTISMPSEFGPIIARVGLVVVRTPNRISVVRRRNH